MLEYYQDPLFRKFLKPILDESGKIIGWAIKTPGVDEVNVVGKTPQDERLTLEFMLEAAYRKLKPESDVK